MDEFKPCVSQAGAHQAVQPLRRIVVPGEKATHLAFQSIARRGFVVHALLTDRTGDNLHRLIATQISDTYFEQS